jgi:hypothetical protein
VANLLYFGSIIQSTPDYIKDSEAMLPAGFYADLGEARMGEANPASRLTSY